MTENKLFLALLFLFPTCISLMLLINIWVKLTSRSLLQGEEIFFIVGTWPDPNRHSVTEFAQARGDALESAFHMG